MRELSRDVGNVLVHFDQAKMLKNLSSIFNLPYNDFLKIFFRENENYELGLYSSKELYWKMIERSSATPVPGGVGPMTIAMLLSNTYDAFLKKIDGN